MKRKAQFYILTALILIGASFAIVAPKAYVSEPDRTFKELRQNHEKEALITVNNAIYEGKNVTKQFEDFNIRFLAYAKSRDPRFGFAYILNNDGKASIKNMMDTSIGISIGLLSKTLDRKESFEADASNIVLTYNNRKYSFELGKTGPGKKPAELNVLYASKKENDINIYVRR